MKLLEFEKVTWEIWIPQIVDHFPCSICHNKIATYRVKYEHRGTIVTSVVCEECFKSNFE